MRFFFYSHDGLGLGHVRRHVAIASALMRRAPEARILLATSVDEVSELGLPPHVDTLKLPGLRKVANGQYAARRLGLERFEIHRLRSALLRAAVGSFEPDVVLVDRHPLGAGGEFREGLDVAKVAGCTVILGLRDILDEPALVRRELIASGLHHKIAEIFSQVLVYGDQQVFDPIEAYQLPPGLAAMIRFCGYVVNRWPPISPEVWANSAAHAEERQPVVLGTTGGGEDGFPILREFVAAAAGTGWRAVAVTGPQLGEAEVETLRESAAANQVTLMRFIPSLPTVFDSVNALVCMGGYNTLAEAAYKGMPTVCVPRITPRREQLMRARRFEQFGLVRTLHPRELTRGRLRSEIQSALDTPRAELLERAHQVMNFDGASHVAQCLIDSAMSGLGKMPAALRLRRVPVRSGPVAAAGL
ncbi:MAG TPA: glycosyltransferase [Verrucomicrobiae bacterium]